MQVQAQQVLCLDSCRAMALRNNKTMQIAQERIKAAEYQKKQAFAAYLPGIDFAGGYMYNQKEISLLSGDQMLPTKTFNPATGTYDFNLLTGPDGRSVDEELLLPDGLLEEVLPLLLEEEPLLLLFRRLSSFLKCFI